ncbi:hypothetical protein [Streptobacillus moniliformis]|uniref:hypothetical protein n=1 Tax=Streptobacillus moniliformis TaxID=34105 RepID=UPI0018C874EB
MILIFPLNLLITKNKADLLVSVDRNSKNSVNIVKDYRNPNKTHSFSFGNVVTEINNQLSKKNIPFQYSLKNGTIKKNLLQMY